MVEIVFWFLFRNLKKIQVIPVFVLLFIIGFIEYTYNKTPLPWGINIIPVPLIFYAAGYYGKKLIDFRISNLHSLFIIIISGALLIFISSINGKIEVSDTYYGNYFYFWPGAVAGIIFMITICKLLGNLSENITLMKFIGKNTLLIFAFHLTAGSALKAFSFYILKQPISIYEKNMIVLVYSILSILILLPFVQFINKKIPWIAGRAKNEI
jgi:fucose 4-O-acetylase-like acetyltransferase